MESVFLFILKKTPAWFVSWSFRRVFGRKDVVVFERLLELPKWKKVSFDSPEKWIFEDDNSFTIEVCNDPDRFSEPWTDYFPDTHSFKEKVLLKINGELVTGRIFFVCVDGGRYFVPMPQTSIVHDRRHFYWDKQSLDYKLFKVIGRVDCLYGSLEEFGDACGVKIK